MPFNIPFISIQRVPASQIAMDSTQFHIISGRTVYEMFEDIDANLVSINQQIPSGLNIDIWDSVYSTVQAGSAFWDSTTDILYLSSAISSIIIPNYDLEISALSSAIDLSNIDIVTLSSDLTNHIINSAIHFEQNDIQITESQIIDLKSYLLSGDLPTKLSEFENDTNFISSVNLTEYAKLTDIPTIPDDISYFNNDIGYITGVDLSPYALSSTLQNHTTDSTIHFTQSSIEIEISQVNSLSAELNLKVNKDEVERLKWIDLVTSWTVEPSSVAYSGGDGEVLEYTYGTTKYYRFIPSTYDSNEDKFYSTYSNPTLSGLIATRGVTI